LVETLLVKLLVIAFYAYLVGLAISKQSPNSKLLLSFAISWFFYSVISGWADSTGNNVAISIAGTLIINFPLAVFGLLGSSVFVAVRERFRKRPPTNSTSPDAP